jgi:hypothetical protein
MNARLQGFLNFLDLLAEGQRRQAEAIAGRHFYLELEEARVTAAPNAQVVKFPLTAHQKAHSLRGDREHRVTTVN